jgi:hypothetical protein
MDERLTKALEFGNYSATIANQKQLIKNRVKQLTTVHHNNGVFYADTSTISFVQTLIANGATGSIIVDTKENPIRITSLVEFQETLLSAYNDAMNEYEAEFEKLKKVRNLKKLMDW